MAEQIIKIEISGVYGAINAFRLKCIDKKGFVTYTPGINYVMEMLGDKNSMYVYANWSSIVGWGIVPGRLPPQNQEW